MSKQTIYLHLKSHDINPTDEPSISWELLHRNIQASSESKIIEALEIQRRSNNIINGCIGRTISI